MTTKTKQTSKSLPRKKAVARRKTASKTYCPPKGDSWRRLREGLAVAGIKRKYLREVILPSWWDEAVLETPNGFLETVAIIRQRTGLPMEGMLRGAEVAFPSGRGIRFKRSKGLSEADVRGAHTLARQVAETVAEYYEGPCLEKFPALETIHARLKESGSADWVELPDVLRFCVEVGIPVLHINNFPNGFKKPDGMAVRTKSGRPVIVLFKRSSRPSWMVFTLAHELGHLLRGHVPEGGAFVDGNLADDGDETEEREANEAASIILTGQADLGLHSSGPMTATSLAQAARIFAGKYRIAPGVACLNWGRNTGNWPVASGAVKILEGSADAISMVSKGGTVGLDLNALPDDVAEWLRRMGVGI